MEKTFWLKNPSILFINNNYIKIFPTYKMSRIEQLNTITRLCIYYIALILILNKNNIYLGLPFFIICFIIIIYYIYDNDYNGKYNDFVNKKLNRNNKDKKINEFKDILEVGYYDTEGKLKFGRKNDLKTNDEKAKDFVNYTYNELLEYEKNSARKPTKDNPFMNIPVTEFGKENIPAASNVYDKDIAKDMEKNFNIDLYRDVTDLFDNKNSQRIWYTTPITSIPNDQGSFANWLYKTNDICKINQGSCLRYEDLRFKR